MTKIEKLRQLTELDLLEAADKYYSTKEFLRNNNFPSKHARYAKIVNDKLIEYDIEWLKRDSVCKKCPVCGKEFYTAENKTCSTSCGNKLRKEIKYCLYCGKEVNNKYCNTKCQNEHEYEQYIKQWKSGLKTGVYNTPTLGISRYIRRYILKKYNYSCKICGWDKVHPIDGKPLVEINHIDGNAANNSENNLELLCPNCHSMTKNFRARNSNSSRQR